MLRQSNLQYLSGQTVFGVFENGEPELNKLGFYFIAVILVIE